MKAPLSILKTLAVVFSLSLAACGGGGGSTPTGTGDTGSTSTSLSGIAAAGAPIIGTVTVKGALGNTKSALIEANGNYDVDVTGLTAPYRLRAVGTVGGRTYKLHSYAEEATAGATVNITPFTDLIVANAAQQIAESFFDSNTSTSIDPADLAAQEDALQAKLKDVFDALGIDSAINLLTSTFSADHSGLDAALDIVRIEVDGNTNIATITNLVENTSITDDVTDGTDAGTLTVINAGNLQNTAAENQSIAGLFTELTTKFASGLPTAASIEAFFTTDFLDYDQSLSQFLTEITTDPSTIGLTFSNVAISDLTATTATVTFYVTFGGVLDLEPEIWTAVKDGTAGWQLRGNQVPADYWFNFHCNDGSGTGNGAGACGVNTMIEDNDFDNNGTSSAAFASATASIIGSDSVVKGIIHLGTPSNANGGTAGQIQIYNAGVGFQGDWKAFGNTNADIDPSIFVAGDTIQFDLYTEQLDISDTNAPAIEANATPVFTFNRPILYAPSTSPLYPDATVATIAALPDYVIGDDLTISWTNQTGTHNSEVLVQISDSNFQQIQIWTETDTETDNSITFAGSELSTSILDQNAATYELRIRIYAQDEVTGQQHSRDYVVDIAGPAAPVTPPGGSGGATGISCTTESGWVDAADGGLGAPVTPYSFAEFETAVNDCGALTITRSDVAGIVLVDGTETITYNDTGAAATKAEPETGNFSDVGESIDFEWYIETVNGNDYVVVYTDSTIDTGLPAGFSLRDTTALTGVSGTGVAGDTFTFIHYSEQSNYGDMKRDVASDGEIWTGHYIKQ